MLTCEQFDIRIQDLMDQRLELSNDSLLCEHARYCSRCRSLLDSFLSLEDSFSGKIPASYFEQAHATPSPQNVGATAWFRLGAMLAMGVVIGLIVANLDFQWMPDVAGSNARPHRESVARAPVGDAVAATPSSSSDTEPTALTVVDTVAKAPEMRADSDQHLPQSPIGNSVPSRANNHPLTLISFEQIRRQYPTLDLYYRLTDEIPGVRTIKDSFRVAWKFFEHGLPFQPFE